jgi:hypothetical protein
VNIHRQTHLMYPTIGQTALRSVVVSGSPSYIYALRNKNRLFVSGCMCTAVGQQQPGGDFCVALIFSKAGHLKRAGAEWLVGWLAVMHAHAKRATHYARGGRTITHLRPLRQPLFAPKAHHPGCLPACAHHKDETLLVCVVKMAKWVGFTQTNASTCFLFLSLRSRQRGDSLGEKNYIQPCW